MILTYKELTKWNKKDEEILKDMNYFNTLYKNKKGKMKFKTV